MPYADACLRKMYRLHACFSHVTPRYGAYSIYLRRLIFFAIVSPLDAAR